MDPVHRGKINDIISVKMVIIIILAAIFLLLLFIKMKTRRMKAAILIGYLLTIIALLLSVVLLFSSTQWEILLPLLAASYASVILFLVFWNIRHAKKNFLLFCVPVLCFAAGIGVNKYYEKIQAVPAVREHSILMYQYEPFRKNPSLAVLDGESDLKITANAPVLDGATALLPVYASFVQAVFDEEAFRDTGDNLQKYIYCSGTEAAYENLLEGRADIIFCAEPSDAQARLFADNDLSLKLVPIGKDAFVFFVNKFNTVGNISINDIRGIYSGKIKNWKELGGIDKKIIAFQRQENSGSQSMLEKIMDVPVIKPRRENVNGDMGGIINQVADYRNFSNAIGYSFLYFTAEMARSDQIKLLSVNGILPSKETIRNNAYPFSGNFYAIYIDRNEKNENIEPLINWILSGQGQDLIEKVGYVPIRD